MIITPINKQFFNPSNNWLFKMPAVSTAAPKAIFKKLKYVKKLLAMICFMDLVFG